MSIDQIITIVRYVIVVVGAVWSIRAIVKRFIPFCVRAAAKPISDPIRADVRELREMLEEHDGDIDRHNQVGDATAGGQ